MERERARESESQRESGEDKEKRGRNAERSGARVSVVLTLRPNNKSAIAYISDS
jgi:ribosome assembly protein YihI (activator of Der GTPase)